MQDEFFRRIETPPPAHVFIPRGICQRIESIVDEEHGKLTIEQIKKICSEVFRSYPVEYCYLFGSYAKGKETEASDIDLLIAMPIDGLKFFELLEVLRERLGKRVDLLDIAQLNNNPDLVQEILKDGIKIYEQQKRRSLLSG